MYKKLLISLLVMMQGYLSPAQWQLSNSGINTFYDLQCVYFPNASTGYAGGPSALYKTVNGGTSWTDILNAVPNAYRSVSGIYFTSSDTGFICGWASLNANNWPTNGFILKTVNGGTSWSVALSNAPAPIFSVRLTGNLQGFAAGGTTDGAAGVYTTTNGGNTWTLQSSLDNMNLHIFDMDVTPSGNVFLSGMWKKGSFDFKEIVFRKLAASSTYDSTTFDSPMFCTMYFKTKFLNDNFGVMVGNKCFNKTTNGGASWTPISLNNATSSADFRAIDFATTSNGWAGGTNGDFYQTSDGGANWTSVNMSTTETFKDIYFLNATTGFAVGDAGLVYKYSPNSVTSLNKANISFYPNPAKDELHFSNLVAGSKYQFTLTDLSGRKILHTDLSKERNKADIGSVSPGVYLLTVAEGNQLLLKERLMVFE